MIQTAAVKQAAEMQAVGSWSPITSPSTGRPALAATTRFGLVRVGFVAHVRWLPAFVIGTMAAFLLTTIAHAQVAAGLPNAAANPLAQAHPQQKPVVPMAPALPGASARAPAAPATQRATDMSPNAALFDAINRGDIAAARDALDRGADLRATNILGLTPLELSIDLGRNDISFLLLSMRGEEGGSAPPVDGTPASGSPFGGTAGSQSAQAGRAPVTSTRRPVPAAHAAPIHPAPTSQLASDSGTPVPSAGFLGFGPHPASN